MHGFILLLSSVAYWEKDQSVSKEIMARLDKIEMIFREVSGQNPNWSRVRDLLEGFPNHEERMEALIQDGELLKQQPNRWERERRETMALLTYMRIVFDFHIQKYPELRSDFDRHIIERMVEGGQPKTTVRRSP